MRLFLIGVILLLCQTGIAQEFSLKLIEPATSASFRALSVVDDKNAWVSGTQGYVGRSQDGGETWNFIQVPGFEKFDFRSLYAFSDRKAVIANAGSPANILLTDDGGKTWKTVYTNSDTAAFFDGVDFWNNDDGIIYGDPINDRMLLLRTSDGGLSWKESEEGKRPLMNRGEASFAASGTNIRCSGSSDVMIATGGLTSRLWHSNDKGNSWRSITVPILQGEPTTGIFSFWRRNNHIIVVGGNYLQDTVSIKHVFSSTDKGKSWNFPNAPTRGYRECVERVDDKIFLAAGPAGIDLSRDDGRTWKPFSDEKYFHVVRRARKGSVIILAGGKGKLAILKKEN